MSSKLASRLLLSLAAAGVLPACGNINDGHPPIAFTTLASRSTSGALGNQRSVEAAISGDGRFVAFASASGSFASLNTNGIKNIFRHSLETGITELVSIGIGGNPADLPCFRPSISNDGRWIAFESPADLTGGGAGTLQIFRRDMDAAPGTGIELVSAASGTPGNNDSKEPSISADGRFVAFASRASNFGNSPANGANMIYRRDMNGSTIIPVSVTLAQGEPTPGFLADPANPGSKSPSISADGSRVAFTSDCSDLIATDFNEIDDIFVATIGATIDTVSASPGLSGFGGGGFSSAPSLSGNGLFVAYQSSAPDLVAVDSNSSANDIFVFDIVQGMVTLASVNEAGFQGSIAEESTTPSMSFDGRYVAFSSTASNIVASESNLGADIFVKDLITGKVTHASVNTSGAQGNLTQGSFTPSLSADGRSVSFITEAPLVREDINGVTDVYVRSPLR